jgi:CMP-N-acetylneuraminic acid synthetase
MKKNQNIIAFLPIRKGSQRIKNKNTKDFANIKGGLTYIKLSQLLKVKSINKIIVSTNDDEVKAIAKAFNNDKIIIDNRADILSSAKTSTDDLVCYVPTLIDEGIVIWTHVTSPFITEDRYEKAIESYFKNINRYDSLMSVTKIQKFIWNKSNPITYDRREEKWPRTQSLEPVYEINSGIFIANISIYQTLKDRIGKKPFFYTLDEKESYDIDWEENFEIAEMIWKYRYN